MRVILVLLMLLGGGGTAHVRDELAGRWVGTSICTEPRGACHDETASYRISKHADADKVTIDAGKIVNGKEESMGILDFTVDANAHAIQTDVKSRRGPFRIKLVWKGNEMTGTFVDLENGRVLRNVALKKE